MKSKSQISAEFIIIASVSLVVFLIMFSIIDKRNDELYSERTMLYARMESDKLASSINTIFLAGGGAQKTISLPETLRDDKNYTINIYPTHHLVEIIWNSLGKNKQYTSILITADITGNLTSLKNITLIISNSDGGIVIG
ncbi:hypothetical protein KY342_02485 [Candidatus Woesearchaeota archaeon]|nr:hypothetical protein [Candidatus Woesearchaeota archaeon]